MTKYVTVVVRYDDETKVPTFNANMKVLGGVVDSVQFNNALEEMGEMEEYIADLQSQIEN